MISARYCNHAAVRKGLRWAEEVVAGTVPAGKLTILACKRQLHDLTRKRYKYEFSADEAERVVDFCERLPHVKGAQFAGKRMNFTAEPWQCFFLTTLFGWVDKKKFTRRFREAYLCVARKNGKSFLAAAIGLFMLLADGEHGAEVYSGATTEKQAYEVFRPAKQMLRRFKELRELAGADIMAHSISVPADGSRFEALVGDPGDGASPSLAIVDEYHEHKSNNLFDTMISGMGARLQPMQLVTTTAGSTISGPCHTYQKELEKILTGSVKKSPVHETKFVLIFHTDDNDDWTDPKVLVKANPNIDVSVSKEYLIHRQQDAAGSPAKQNVFKNKHLNLWTAARSAYYNLINWGKCKNSQANIQRFAGEPCVIGVDLSSKSDLTAVMRVFPVVDQRVHYHLFPRFYLPEDKVLDDPNGMYQTWLNAGFLKITEGNEIDLQIIERDLMQDMERFDVLEVAYDPWRGAEISRRMRDSGAPMVEFRNTTQNMSEPMKETEAAINGKRVTHDDNDVMSWCVSNTVARMDANENVFPRKEGNENKIDGVTALIMAVGRTMFREDLPSVDDWLSDPIVLS